MTSNHLFGINRKTTFLKGDYAKPYCYNANHISKMNPAGNAIDAYVLNRVFN
jgi:hypothetical protein